MWKLTNFSMDRPLAGDAFSSTVFVPWTFLQFHVRILGGSDKLKNIYL